MAEASPASTINPLNILFKDLAKSLNEDDVNEMKNLFRGEQVSEEDMDKLRSALDVFHHLKKRGDIDGNNLDLLVQLFEEMGKTPLKERVCKFQREHSTKTGHENTKDEQSGQETILQSLLTLTLKITLLLEKVEEVLSQEKERKLEDEIVERGLRKQMALVSEEFVKAIKDKDNVKIQQINEFLIQYNAFLKELKPGSLVLVLQFLTEEDLQYFWQKYKDGTVEKGLSDIIIPTAVREKARNAGYTIRLQVEIDEKQCIEVKRKMHAISAFPSACRTTWCRDAQRDKWYSFVMDQIQDRQQASHLLEQSISNPVIQALRQEEFFFPAIVSFWFENSFTLPPTVTKATEYAVIHHAEMYCKENDLEVENLREIVKARFNDIGKHLYEHISEENVGRLYPSWIDESISNLESHLFGLLTKSEDFYTFPGKYVYSYIIAVYFSNIIALSPHNIPMYIREERMKTLQTYLPYCFPYITGILGDKALCFLKEVTIFSTMQTSVDIDDLVMAANCLFESERPSVFARDIEKLLGQNHSLDLSTCTGISNQSIHSLLVILQYTSIIKDIKLYSEIDEGFLSSEFKECLTNIMADPLAVDRCKIRINNSHDFTVTARLLRILPLLCKHAKSRSGSDITQQPAVTSLSISSDVSMLEEIPTFAMEMFVKMLSCMPHLEKLSLTGLGEKLSRQFLGCLSKETVGLNINTMCLAGNELSWKHCRLLLDTLNAMPCLHSLDLSRNNIGSLGCTILLPVKDEIYVSVDGNNIAHGLLDILSSCTPREQLQTAGVNTLESMDDVASLMKSLGSVRHIDCTKLSNSQLSKLCENLSLLHNIVSIDLSGSELNQQIVLLLSERLNHLKELKKVDLSHCIVSRVDFKVLLQHISLEVTDLNLSATNMSGVLLDNLKQFKNLKHLNLSNNNLISSDLIFWYIPMTVTHLNLSHNNLHEESCRNLQNLTKLEELDVSYNKLTSADIQSILKAISTTVTTLNISNNNLEEMHEPFEHLTQLKQLDLSNNDLDTCLNLSLPSSITKLDLSHNQIVDIGQSFNHLSQLIHLNLSHNKVKLSLHDILTNMPTKVRYLNMSSNSIEDVASVGNIISSFNDLQLIDLGSNKFGDIGIQNLLNVVKSKDMAKIKVSHNFTLMPHIIDQMPIVSINLEKDNLLLSEVESSCIYDHLMQVTEINVSGLSEEKCSGICKSLMMLTNLSKLVMTKCCMTNDQNLITSLQHLHALRELDLSNNVLDSATICDIVRVLPSTLISLNLSHNMAKTEFNLKHLTKLVRLDLSHNSLQVPMHSLLSNISQKLECFDVSFNKIENVDELGKLLPDFSRLRCINMGSNSLGAFGVQKLFSEIENCNCDIDVSHNLSGLQKIIPHTTWQPPVSASLPDFERENLTIKDENLQVFFENISKLTSVEIPQNVQWSDTDYESVLNDMSIFSNMESLTFSLFNPTTCLYLAKTLKNLSCLRHLDISGSNIDNKGVAAIGNSLLLLKRLEDVNFSNTNIDMKGVKILLNIHRQHTSQPFINVANNFHNLPGILPYIEDQLIRSATEVLDLDSVELPVQSLAVIAQITRLTVKEKCWLDKDFVMFTQGLSHLNLHRLQYLDLSHNKIGDSGAKSLSEVIRSMHRLTYLDLSHNNIGDSGARSLSEGMRSMDGLTHLDLSHNNIGDSGAWSLSKGMRSMHRLTHLDLSHNNIGDSGAKSLSEGMRSMDELTHLDLSHNNIRDSGAKSLIQGMSSMDGLTHLDLRYNNTKYSGTKFYSEGSSSITSLEKSQAASEEGKTTYKSAKSSKLFSQEGQHFKEMPYQKLEHKKQSIQPSSPQPSTSGYLPTEKDPAKS